MNTGSDTSKQRKNRVSVLVLLFITVLAASWVWHITSRNYHFQEVDSSGTYNILYEFPGSTLRFIALLYPHGSFISTSTAEKILSHDSIRSIKNTYLSSFSDEFLINQLTQASLLSTFRYGLTQAISSAPLPFAVQSFFSMGIGSTYSPGAGFVYGLVSGPNADYLTFMSRSMVVSITLFHVSVLLLFLINRKLGVSDGVNSLVCFLMLFSISIYSSGIHVGSTVWNFTTEFLWLYFLVTYYKHPEIHRHIAWLTGVLIFFNYLILLFWLAFMFIRLFEWWKQTQSRSLKKFGVWFWGTIKSQLPAIILIGTATILFFLPGQGFRGSATFATLPSDVYYTVLNFFSWYTHSAPFNLLQYSMGVLLLASSLLFFIPKQTEGSVHSLVKQICLLVLALYIVLAILHTLSFAPTRHILFLIPILFISIAQGLSILSKKTGIHIPTYVSVSALTILSVLGMYCVFLRGFDTADRTVFLNTTDPEVSTIGIHDGSYDIYYKYAENKTPVTFMHPKIFEAGKTYLYVSPSVAFETQMREWRKEHDMEIEILYDAREITDAYFIAHNPNFERFRYSRPNNLYQTKFTVRSVSKK
ncbi:MAG TPA: hypothetical protein PLF31_01265 [Candidatus Paceibacterota bacterium]|nr:hypothetical protein [Candidatus Paceibacterota bacterium]